MGDLGLRCLENTFLYHLFLLYHSITFFHFELTFCLMLFYYLHLLCLHATFLFFIFGPFSMLMSCGCFSVVYF